MGVLLYKGQVTAHWIETKELVAFCVTYYIQREVKSMFLVEIIWRHMSISRDTRDCKSEAKIIQAGAT